MEDALIQGARLRLVLAADAPPALREEVLAQGGEPAPPRLEDAYMSALGGISQQPSPYARPSAATAEGPRGPHWRRACRGDARKTTASGPQGRPPRRASPPAV